MAEINDIAENYKKLLNESLRTQMNLKSRLEKAMRDLSLEDRKNHLKEYNEAVKVIDANINEIKKGING